MSNRKEYTLPNGKKAVFEYDVCGIGKITLECMDELMGMITDRPQGWTLCSDRLPDACKDVLLTCEVRPINYKPFRYVCTAQWIPKFCKEALGIDWDEEATEYCEEDDEFYPHEGWYESISNWDDYSLVGISDFAIAWKPLPEPWEGADDES